jgi:exodeoxyribonuclease V alpha subunit
MSDKKIKVTFRKSIFQSDNGYVIGLFKLLETDYEELIDNVGKLITVTGYFLELNDNDNLLLIGNLVRHPKYGLQFNMTSYELVKPSEKEAIISFLSSDMFKGIGTVLATRIVDNFGEDTLNIITNKKENLYLVNGLTEKKIELIHETVLKHQNYSKIGINLNTLGFNQKEAALIYSIYKENTLDIINNNPFILYLDEIDISFKKIEKVANNLNIDINNINRLTASIIYILKEYMFKSGSTYIRNDDLHTYLNRYFNYYLSDDIYLEAINYLVMNNLICYEEDLVFLTDYYLGEYYISSSLKERVNTKKKDINYDNILEDIETKFDIKYNYEQKEAIISAMTNNILVITGGPGTGKTTIIKAILEMYKRVNKLTSISMLDHVKLLAPTGRASKKMNESSNYPSSTIHRFLKWNKDDNSFRVNEKNKDTSNLIIVDEFSMVDTLLFTNLLKGIKSDSKLILVGDYNQLPSVSPGQVLKDIIDSNVIPVISLEELYRTSSESYIPVLADNIKKELIDDIDISTSDYVFIKEDRNNIREVLKNTIVNLTNMDIDYKDIQVLAPMYKTYNGIDNLNKDLQELFNPKNNTLNEYKYSEIIFREQDKVLLLTNRPEDNVFNGDVGIITSITKNNIYVDFDENLVRFTHKELIDLKHGYAISIHKSQGGEFKHVIMPVSFEYNRMLYKRLIYTGVTRTKENLILIGEIEAFKKGILNNNESKRETLLLDRLIN